MSHVRTINSIYLQSQVRKSTGSRVERAECSLIIGTGCRVQLFLAWSSLAQSVCQRAFSLLAIWCLRPWVWILHSTKEDNLSRFDSNIACLCQSTEINNTKHVPCQDYKLMKASKTYTCVMWKEIPLRHWNWPKIFTHVYKINTCIQYHLVTTAAIWCSLLCYELHF